MPYCRECGEEVQEGAAFCPKCGARVASEGRPWLATWGERFVAYLIDIILLSVVLGWFSLPGLYWVPSAWRIPRFIPFVDLGARNLVYFIYWTLMEGTYGQSVGKMAMRLEVSHVGGGDINVTEAAIQSAGKAFLLPLDCIVGWFFYPDKGQRLFNYLSETVVLKRR